MKKGYGKHILEESKPQSESQKRQRIKRSSESPKTQMTRSVNNEIDEAKSKSQQKVSRNSKAITKQTLHVNHMKPRQKKMLSK